PHLVSLHLLCAPLLPTQWKIPDVSGLRAHALSFMKGPKYARKMSRNQLYRSGTKGLTSWPKDILVSAVEEIHRFRQDVANIVGKSRRRLVISTKVSQNARENIPILFSTDAFSTSSTPEGFNPPTPPAFNPPTPEPMELPYSIDQ
ncbi:unnamed protein product, partial [Clonostachys solani]